MYYTIMESREVHSDQSVVLAKNGSEYTVCFHSEETGYVSKNFPTNETAMVAMQKILDAFMTGCYSAQDRASWLN